MTTEAVVKNIKGGEKSAQTASGRTAGANAGGEARQGNSNKEKKEEVLTDLSSAGVAALLRGQFDVEREGEGTAEEGPAGKGIEAVPGAENTAATPQSAPGRTAGEDAGGEGNDQPQNTRNTQKEAGAEGEGTETSQTEGTENPEQEGTEGTETEGTENPGGELPEELQAAVGQWEETGGELPPVLQVLVEKRIGKLVKQREEATSLRVSAEAKVKTLEEEVAALKADPRRPGAAGPVTIAHSENELNGLEEKASGFLSDAEAFLDESATAAEAARVQRFMEENGIADNGGLKRRVREVNGWLTRQLPKQREALQRFRDGEAQVEPIVKKFFPWMEQKSSAEYQQAQKALEIFPDLPSRTPEWKVALGVYVLGVNAMKALAGQTSSGLTAPGGPGAKASNGGPAKPAAGATNGAKAPVKSPVKGAAAPVASVRNGGRQAQEEGARQRFAAAPTRENVTELLKAAL